MATTSNSVQSALPIDDKLRELIDDIYAQVPADDVFNDLELSIVRAIDFALPDTPGAIPAGQASMAPLNQARGNAVRIAEATDLIATWFSVVGSPDWADKDPLAKRAIRAQIMANFGVELPAAEGRLSMLAIGERLARATPRHASRGSWRSTVVDSRVSERFAEVATQAATGARDAVAALARYADERGLPNDSLSRLPLKLLDNQTKALSENVFNSGIRYMTFLHSLHGS